MKTEQELRKERMISGVLQDMATGGFVVITTKQILHDKTGAGLLIVGANNEGGIEWRQVWYVGIVTGGSSDEYYEYMSRCLT
jgi:hypothetical protein